MPSLNEFQGKAIKEHREWVAANAIDLLPDGVEFELKSFGRWIVDCEKVEKEELSEKVDFMRRMLASSKGRDPLYHKGKGFYFRYAEECYVRRFN